MVIRKIFPYQIDQERESEQIDRALLKNVLDIFVEIGMGQMEYYENDFEDALLKDTAAYYSRKASNWIVEDSCPDYMLKVIIVFPLFLWQVSLACYTMLRRSFCYLKLQAEECLKKEKDRVAHYLHSSSETRLLEVVMRRYRHSCPKYCCVLFEKWFLMNDYISFFMNAKILISSS